MMLALVRFEAKICDCGFHESMASDPTNFFTFEERVCPVCRGSAQYLRKRKDQDEEARKTLGEQAPTDPADGRSIYTRLMSPEEIEEVRHRRSSGISPSRAG